jgi:serine protease
MRSLVLLSVVVLLVFAAAVEANPGKVIRHEDGIDRQFIIVLADETPVHAVEGLARSLAASYGLDLKQVWPHSLQGFMVVGSEASIAALADDPRVKYAEQNVEGVIPEYVSATQWAWYDTDPYSCSDSTSCQEYLWNLDRLDELSWKDRDGTHNLCTEGRSAYAYVIDTGIQGTHSEFEGRVVKSLNFAGSANGASDTKNGCQDDSFNSGHGTMVAGMLGGSRVGSAKTTIVSLRFMDCNMTYTATDLIEAVEWIADPSRNPKIDPGTGKHSGAGVINHSGFIPVWDTTFHSYGDQVARTVTRTGLPFFTSADNYSTDACQFSPNHRAYTRTNRSGAVFVVGATGVEKSDTVNDYRYQKWESVDGYIRAAIGQGSGSNGGPCVSIYAPGISIWTARKAAVGVNNEYVRIDGSSLSSPLVAGVAARYMERETNRTGVTPSYQQVYDWLLSQSSTSVERTTTAETYWACVEIGAGGLFDFYPSRTYISACPSAQSGPYQFNQRSNTSDARMVFFDEGYCPAP